MFNSDIKIIEPTDPKQVLHLLDMNSYFGDRLHVESLDSAMMLNYEYAIENTNNFGEFCDTMHTALYWMNKNYSHLCQIEKSSEAINLSTKIGQGEEIEEEKYRWDILFGSWLSFITHDSIKLRKEFMGELSGMDEQQFIDELTSHSHNLLMVETFCINWVKKMIDPCRAAGYGHYMLYFMMKVMMENKMRDKDCGVMNQVITNLCIFTQSASKLCGMDEHNLPLN